MIRSCNRFLIVLTICIASFIDAQAGYKSNINFSSGAILTNQIEIRFDSDGFPTIYAVKRNNNQLWLKNSILTPNRNDVIHWHYDQKSKLLILKTNQLPGQFNIQIASNQLTIVSNINIVGNNGNLQPLGEFTVTPIDD